MKFKIFFEDLNADAQRRLVEASGVKDAADTSWGANIFPLATFSVPEGAEGTASFWDEDHFYSHMDGSIVEWIYHNPDAASGDQFVVNRFSAYMLAVAVKKFSELPEEEMARSVFDYIGSACHQWCCDVGECGYEEAKAKFLSEPIAVGMTKETLDKLLQLADDFMKEWMGGVENA